MSDEKASVNEIAESFLRKYRADSGATAEPPPVQTADSMRTGVYNLSEVHEDAAVLLHQLMKTTCERRRAEDKPECIEVDEIGLLVLERQKGIQTMYFCGLKKDQPVWSYGLEHLAQRLNFAEAQKLAMEFGQDVFAMPAKSVASTCVQVYEFSFSDLSGEPHPVGPFVYKTQQGHAPCAFVLSKPKLKVRLTGVG